MITAARPQGGPSAFGTHVDSIFIRDLRIPTTIGVYAWERAIRQTVSLDIELGGDIRRAAASDNIADTLDYRAVAKRVIAFVQESRFLLVETLAERVANLILSEFAVPWLKLQVNKLGAVRGARDVGIIIERGERDAHGGGTR